MRGGEAGEIFAIREVEVRSGKVGKSLKRGEWK